MKRYAIFLAVAAIFSAALCPSSNAAPDGEIPPFDTLYGSSSVTLFRYGPFSRNDTVFYYEGRRSYGKYTDTCRVFLDRDTGSVNFRRMLRRAELDRYTLRDIDDQLVRWAEAGVELSHSEELAQLSGTYLPLCSIGGEIMMSDYRQFPAYISDSTIIWHESDTWCLAVKEVTSVDEDMLEVKALAYYSPETATVDIKVIDRERGVLWINTKGNNYGPRGYYVLSSKASGFPLLVWYDSEGEPSGIELPFGKIDL